MLRVFRSVVVGAPWISLGCIRLAYAFVCRGRDPHSLDIFCCDDPACECCFLRRACESALVELRWCAGCSPVRGRRAGSEVFPLHLRRLSQWRQFPRRQRWSRSGIWPPFWPRSPHRVARTLWVAERQSRLVAMRNSIAVTTKPAVMVPLTLVSAFCVGLPGPISPLASISKMTTTVTIQ